MTKYDRRVGHSWDETPVRTQDFNRRLVDKISEAISQAKEQDRKDIVDRLQTIYRKILNDDRALREMLGLCDRRDR